MTRVATPVLDWSRVGSPPSNVPGSAPGIAGDLTVGVTVAALPGAWTGNPTGYSYQWLANGLVIPGATFAFLLIASAQLGLYLSLRVIATNAGGDSIPATSLAVGPVINPISSGPSLDFSDPANSQYIGII